MRLIWDGFESGIDEGERGLSEEIKTTHAVLDSSCKSLETSLNGCKCAEWCKEGWVECGEVEGEERRKEERDLDSLTDVLNRLGCTAPR